MAKRIETCLPAVTNEIKSEKRTSWRYKLNAIDLLRKRKLKWTRGILNHSNRFFSVLLKWIESWRRARTNLYQLLKLTASVQTGFSLVVWVLLRVCLENILFRFDDFIVSIPLSRKFQACWYFQYLPDLSFLIMPTNLKLSFLIFNFLFQNTILRSLPG